MAISETTVHLKAAFGCHAIATFKVLACALKTQLKLHQSVNFYGVRFAYSMCDDDLP